MTDMNLPSLPSGPRKPSRLGVYYAHLRWDLEWDALKGLGVRDEEVVLIADHSQVLPDYKNNPRVATRDEIYKTLINSFERQQRFA